LPPHLQESTSLSELKRFLRSSDSIVPPYFYKGDRAEQIIHCRLRLEMSELNYDLFNRHLLNHSNCLCGHTQEDAEHYLLHCPNYLVTRRLTIFTLPPHSINAHALLHGNPDVSLKDNDMIFAVVHDFIKQTQRFNLT
jgi:hypothetical protein